MTPEEFDQLPAEIKSSLLSHGISAERIAAIELGAGVFWEPYIKQLNLHGEEVIPR